MIDRQLMERFVADQDSAAFHELVARHSPAVLRACRRFLHDPHEAEDAMQATFLVLVRRAPSIRDPEQVDRWLVGVARRVAVRARQRSAGRAERERRWAESHREAGPDAETPLGIEVRRAIREELGQLADVDRTPLTLCYLDGLTHEEAARRIGCPVGTIKARLVRARRRLRDRLDRRGVALGLGLLLLLLGRSRPAPAADPLAEATAAMMDWAAAGDLEAVEARFPGAWHLARDARQAAPWFRTPAILLTLALAVAIVAVGFVSQAVAARGAEAQRVAARLAKVLDASCRAGP